MDELLKQIKLQAESFASTLELEIVDVEYVKEHSMKILRITADSTEGLTVEQSSQLNQLISDYMDTVEFDDDYYIEVTSPGLERPLKTEKDYQKALNQYICINTYQKINNTKELYGYLKQYDENEITITVNKKDLVINKKQISKIRMAIKF